MKNQDNNHNNLSLKSFLIKSASGVFLIKISSTALVLISGIILARSLGPSGYGVYAFTISLVSLLSIPVAMGFPQVLTREIAGCNVKREWGYIKGIIRFSNHIIFFTALGVVGIALIGLFIWTPGGGAFSFKTVAIGLFLVLAMPLAGLSMSVLRGYKYIILSQVPEFLIKPSIFLLLIGGFYFWFDGKILPYQAVTCQVAASFFCLIIAFLFVQLKSSKEIKESHPKYDKRKWIQSALPLLLVSGMQFINRETDILMLGMLTTEEYVGVYRVAQRMANLVLFGLAAVNMAVGPIMAELYIQRNIKRIQSILLKSSFMILLYTIPVSLLFFLVGKDLIVLVFGMEYALAQAPLSILTAAHFLNAAMGSIGVLLVMTGHERESAKALAVSCIFNIVLNSLLIPVYGIVGAAIATGTSVLIWNIITGIYVYKCLQIWPDFLGLFNLLKL